MGVVKYTGPMASFHCPTNAEIRSLKVHFSPKQEGTGDPSPENVREIVGWDGVEVHNDIEIIDIPSQYQRVEYIYNVGTTEWIDTGIIPYTNTKAQIKFANLLTSGDVIFGYSGVPEIQYDDGKDWRLFNYNNRVYFDSQKSRWYGSWLYENIIYEFEMGNYYLKDLSNNTILFSQTPFEFTGIGTITLNHYVSNNTIKNSKNKWYYVKIYDGETLVRNMYPCRRKSDNKPGMYDTVTQTFFTNQGTGEFICGPDVGKTVMEYEFGVLGKNKLSDNANDYVHNYGSPSAKTVPDDFKFENGEFSGTVPEGTRDYCLHLGQIAYPPGTYTISCDYINNGQNYYWQPFVCSYSNTSAWYTALSSAASTAAVSDSGHLERTFTATQPFYVNLTLNSNGNTKQVAENKISNLQLELGSTATFYEPYDPKNTVYGGWVDLISGEVCDNWWKDSWDIGADEGTIKADGTRWIAKNIASAHQCNSDLREKSVCDKLLCLQSGSDQRPRFYMSKVTAYMNLPNDNSPHTITIWYPSVSVTATYHIAPTELQTFLGHNNVWSNADYIEVEYDLHETQEILNRKAFIMANQPHLVAPAAAQLQSFTTDLAAPLKECRVYFKPKQEGEGDPSPENIRPIEGWENIDITIAGNNIIPINYTPAEGKWKPTNGVISGSVYDMGQFPVPKSKLYWSCETRGVTYIGLMDNSIATGTPTYNVVTTTNRNGYTLDNTEGHKYMLMCCNAENIINLKQMVNIGITKTEYSTPSARTIPITFPTEAGTIYGGYVDLVKGEIWETDRLFDCADYLLNYSDIEMVNGNLCRIRSIKFIPTNDNLLLNGIAEIFTPFSGSWGQMTTLNGEHIMVGYNYVGFSSSNFGFTTKEEWFNYLTQNHIKFSALLPTPVLIAIIDPITLKTLRGTNNIWSNSNGDITVQFWRH